MLADFGMQAQEKFCIPAAADTHGLDFDAAKVNSYLHLDKYRVMLFGEQHNGRFDPEIKYHLIRALNTYAGTRHLFMEIGVSAAWRYNQYLQTGDTSFIGRSLVYSAGGYPTFWRRLYEYNQTLPDDKKLVVHGVDFERTDVFSTLLMLSPAGKTPPASLQPMMDTITAHRSDPALIMFTVSDSKMTVYDNSSFMNTLSYIQQQFVSNSTDAKAWFGINYPIVHAILTNKGKAIINPKKRDKLMFNAMQDIITAQAIERFAVFMGKDHTSYNSATSVAGSVREMPGLNDSDILNIAESLYSVTDGVRSGEINDAAIFELNKDCKASILPATGLRRYRSKADYVIVADNTH